MSTPSADQNDPPKSDRSGPPPVPARVRASIADSIRDQRILAHLDAPMLPKGRDVRQFVDHVRCLVFPGFFEDEALATPGVAGWLEGLLGDIHRSACAVIRRAIEYGRHVGIATPNDPAAAPDARSQAERLVDRFLKELPPLRSAMALDVQAAYDGDPAATHADETIACYPGVSAVFSYRLAHILHKLGVPMVPRIITEQAHADTGIDIHPAASIGKSFFIDHGAGVVIGETTIVGDHVKLYQGVTLGARSFEKDAHGRLIRGQKRHPTIGNRVTIYAGACILGGDTTVGDDCVVSGGVFLTYSIPPRHIVRQKQAELVLRSNRDAMPNEDQSRGG